MSSWTYRHAYACRSPGTASGRRKPLGSTTNLGGYLILDAKRRRWHDPKIPPAERDEEWIDAAARAAAEWLGTTVAGLTAINVDVPPYHQSDRDGVWKRYEFRLFRLDVDAHCPLRGDVIAQWLSAGEFLDEQRRPISKTARYIVGALGDFP